MQANRQWRRSEDCETAFKKLEEQLCARPVLTHYDPKLLLKLACDASQYGVGTVIAHLLPSGEQKSITYGSQTLSKAYAQVEKDDRGISHHLQNSKISSIYLWKKISAGH